MVFQAFRSLHASPVSQSVLKQICFVSRSIRFRFPCAPVRSSFSAALDDVKRFRSLGYHAAVIPFQPSNQI